jgi:hypothetical protein
VSNQEWTQIECERMLRLAGWTLAAGVVAAALLQFVGALAVREYARWLWEIEEREFLNLVLNSTPANLENGNLIHRNIAAKSEAKELQ